MRTNRNKVIVTMGFGISLAAFIHDMAWKVSLVLFQEEIEIGNILLRLLTLPMTVMDQ